MIRATVLVAMAALLCAGCATTENALGGDGASCQVPAECEEGFTCKASRCTPHRSRVGQVCVTEKGCEDGLLCSRGRCSAGIATAEANARACRHLRGLMEASTRLHEAQARQHTPEDQLQVELEVFTAECQMRLDDGHATVEDVACVEAGKSIPEVRACP